MADPPKPRQPSSPEVPRTIITGAEQPDRESVNHAGVDGAPQRPPKRTGTLPGYPSRLPDQLPAGPAKAPALPAELAPTQIPPDPWRATKRAPTPAGVMAQARREPPPLPGRDATDLPIDVQVVAPESSPQPDLARLRADLADAQKRNAELERRERVRAEAASPNSWPPKVQASRSVSPAPSSAAPASKPPSSGDWAKLRFKIATAVVAALVLVIAALGYWAVTAINAKAEAIRAAQEAKKKADSREELWRAWASVVIWIEDCRDGRDVRSGEMLLPDPQKMGSARKLEPWQNPCSPKLPPPP